MFFIPEKYIEKFYQTIKSKYNYKSLYKFYKYMDKFIFREYKGIKYLWNFNKIISNYLINENQYFITNNFVERQNHTLNQNIIYKKIFFFKLRKYIIKYRLLF